VSSPRKRSNSTLQAKAGEDGGIELEIMGSTRTTLTIDEFLELPWPEAGKRELLRGELIDLPPAKRKHNRIAHRILKCLEAAVAAAGLAGEVLHEEGYQLGGRHWLVPDVSVTHPEQPGEEYCEGAPLLAVEIISESNTARVIEAKVAEYFAHGAEEVWVLYPDDRHVWVYRSSETAELHTGCYCSPLFGSQQINFDGLI
jgi:Uma2 family endonuclease